MLSKKRASYIATLTVGMVEAIVAKAIELRSKDPTQSSVAAGDLNTAIVTHCAAPAVSSQHQGLVRLTRC